MPKPHQGLRSAVLLRLGVLAAIVLGTGSCAGPSVLEYLHVTIDRPASNATTPATVLIDGKEMGQTAELIEFEGGKCVVTLDRPEAFKPDKYELTVDGTSSLTPKKLVFRHK